VETGVPRWIVEGGGIAGVTAGRGDAIWAEEKRGEITAETRVLRTYWGKGLTLVVKYDYINQVVAVGSL